MTLPSSPATATNARTARSAKAQKHSILNFEMHSVLLVGLLLMAMAAAAAQAQTLTPPPLSPQAANTAPIPHNKATTQDVDAAFDRADTNKDGRLDRREAEHFPAVAQRFDQIDTNHDSFVSREELRKMAGS